MRHLGETVLFYEPGRTKKSLGKVTGKTLTFPQVLDITPLSNTKPQKPVFNVPAELVWDVEQKPGRKRTRLKDLNTEPRQSAGGLRVLLGGR